MWRSKLLTRLRVRGSQTIEHLKFRALLRKMTIDNKMITAYNFPGLFLFLQVVRDAMLCAAKPKEICSTILAVNTKYLSTPWAETSCSLQYANHITSLQKPYANYFNVIKIHNAVLVHSQNAESYIGTAGEWYKVRWTLLWLGKNSTSGSSYCILHKHTVFRPSFSF